jgi:lysozyme
MAWNDELCAPLVAQFEGLAKVGRDKLVYPYLDMLAKPPRWTRGYGRTYGITGQSPAITRARAQVELAAGLSSYGKQVAALAPGLLAKPECMAAVTSWAWNCGIGAFRASRLRRAINENRWWDAAEHLRTPNTAGGVVYRGLTRRRSAERALFILGI